MKKNDEIILDIVSMTADGSGVGRHDGMAVFVPLSAVGDRLKVLILKVKKTYAFGKIIEILEPSDTRTENECNAFKSCGGCVYRHLSYESECEIKENKVYEAIKRIGNINMPPVPILPGLSQNFYRNKAQYPVSQNGQSGFFALHSHRIIPCEKCYLQPEIFDLITSFITKFVKEHSITVYDEKLGKGLLRHIYLRYAEKTDSVMVVLVINGGSFPKSDLLTQGLKDLLGDTLKSLQININRKDTNVVLGEVCKVIYGEGYITDIICGIKIRISPLSFYQVNRTMAEILYKKAAEYASPENKNIIDLYCGAGTIGLSMAGKTKSVIGVEIIPEAIEDAKFNAKANGVNNIEFICADAKDAATQLASKEFKPDIVIVDPPRKGCSSELLETVYHDFRPEKIVYISCDPATLARDIKILSENGYELKEYTPIDLFPRTSHVECVALMIRTEN